MNYRHAFHAGGFADVVKHAVLALVIAHLREKPAAFRVIDTHAGAGLTDLGGPEANRTGEWRDGIGRVVAEPLTGEPASLLAPYLDALAKYNRDGPIAIYPGSPHFALAMLRPQDRLTACELQPDAARRLAAQLRADRRANAVTIDGWIALPAYLPPNERRGVVLVDPPFEQPGEFTRLVSGLVTAHRKWPNGIYVLWYPIKDRRETDAFAGRVARSGIRKILRAEVMVTQGADPGALNGSGLLIINPPWPLERQLGVLLPALAARLAREGAGGTRLDWLAGEK